MLGLTWADVNFLNENFGNSDPERIENQVDFLVTKGFDRITYRKYGEIGHELNHTIMNDIYSFFEAAK